MKIAGLYRMLAINLFLVAATAVYLSYSSGGSHKIIALNGPWKFITGDDARYAHPGYTDAAWETTDLTAPPGAHDGDVGLSGYIPGWTAHGHPGYSGYAWYRMKVSLDTVNKTNLAIAAPAAVDNCYQLFINGSLIGEAGDFSTSTPVTYSIQPRMFVLSEKLTSEKVITIAFRVWMSPASLYAGSGGIHIAPALGDKNEIEKQHKLRWEQTIKGYIVEIILPLMFFLLAITLFALNKTINITASCKWFITGLILLGLVRLNQAVYYWLQIESTHLSDILSSVILRPLVLGSWLMAWRDWFHVPHKWLPKVIVLSTLVYLVFQLLGIAWLWNSVDHAFFRTLGEYTRLVFIVLSFFIVYQGISKDGDRHWLMLLAVLLISIGLFAQEVSALGVTGIWFPYGVGVSRTQYVYAAFIILMYFVLIRKMKMVQPVNVNELRR